MKLLSHRGYWTNDIKKNSPEAFEACFMNGFGLETDIRDYKNEIVVSHDIPNESCHNLQSLFSQYIKIKNHTTLALNIKSDGLQDLLKEILIKYNINNYFVFDMSIPDTLGYINKGIKFFTRQSEYEKEPIFYNEADGIWLDSFNSTWYEIDLINFHLKNNKKIVLVSPELHKRDKYTLWEFMKLNSLHLNDNVFLCTDYPIEAELYFK